MAPADVGLGGFHLVLLGLALAQLQLEEPRTQHLHGLVAVAMLGTVVLALHHGIGGQVGDTHGRFGLVHVLTTRTGGTVHVDAQVSRVDVDLDRIIDLGVDIDRGKRRMSPAAGIERRLANQPVNACLGTQIAIGVFTFHLQRGPLDAGHVTLAFFQQRGGEAAPLAVTQVLTQQHGRPVAGLGTAGARLDLQEAGAGVGRVGEHPPEFQPLHTFLDAKRLALQLFQCGIVVLGHRHFIQVASIGQRPGELLDGAHHVVERAFFLAQFQRRSGVVPDVGGFQGGVDFGQAIFLFVEVKDTP